MPPHNLLEFVVFLLSIRGSSEKYVRDCSVQDDEVILEICFSIVREIVSELAK